jgi:outer membrane lipoprotein YfiO
MGDPHRLLSKMSDGDDLERELLASVQRADPPEHAKAEAWARLSTQIAAVALVSSAHGTAAAATGGAAAQGAKAATGLGVKGALAPVALKVLGTKAVIAAIALGAVGASAAWVHSRATADQRAATAPVSAPPALPAATPPSEEPAPAEAAAAAIVEATAPPAPDTAVKPSAEQSRRDQLSAESALLTQARAELRKGDARGAQQLLNRLQAQFPKGVLGQEREVLAIEVLAARGNAAAAKRRAQAFIAAYPESPHSAQLSRFADAP